MSDLVELEVPDAIMLYAPVVTKDNVDQYMPTRASSPDRDRRRRATVPDATGESPTT